MRPGPQREGNTALSQPSPALRQPCEYLPGSWGAFATAQPSHCPGTSSRPWTAPANSEQRLARQALDFGPSLPLPHLPHRSVMHSSSRPSTPLRPGGPQMSEDKRRPDLGGGTRAGGLGRAAPEQGDMG